MSQTYTENCETTAPPPVCPECGGAGIVTPMGFARNCDACNATGYERGDTPSLLASIQSLIALEDEQGYPATCGQFQSALNPGADLIGAMLAREAAA